MIDYTIEDDVTVRHLEADSVGPAYWYVSKPIIPTRESLNAWYLTDMGWRSHTPKQFDCAFQARTFYEIAKHDGLLDNYEDSIPSHWKSGWEP